MTVGGFNFGVVDNKFLTRSVGLLNPPLPLTLNVSDGVSQALELMVSKRIGCVVVVEDGGEKLAGVFTERDVLMKVVLAKLPPDTPLKDLMTAEPESIEMTAPIALALQLMSQGGYRHLPIVDDNSIPVAIISVKDIVDYIVQCLTRDLQSFGVD